MRPQSVIPYVYTLAWLFVARGSAYTYWIDSTCDRRLDTVEQDFLRMAASSTFRIADPNDANQATAFSRLFKVERTTQFAYDEVQRVMGGIGAMSKTPDRAASNIRIYCDDDEAGVGKRWTLVPDIPDDPYPNSQRILGRDQEWQDTLNGMGRTVISNGCKDPNFLGESYKIKRDQPNQHENDFRTTITLCDTLLNFNIDGSSVLSTSHVPSRKDFTRLDLTSVDVWGSVASYVLLHEMMHFVAYAKIDVRIPNPDGQGGTVLAYGWKKALMLNMAQALQNADSFAQFGLIARLADRRWRLSRDNAKLGDGEFEFDTSLPLQNPMVSNILPPTK